MSHDFKDDAYLNGAGINQILVAHVFRRAGLSTDNTPDQDLSLIKIYVMNVVTAQADGQHPPMITKELVEAAQRMQIIAASRGEDFPLYYELEEAVRAREENLARQIEDQTDLQYTHFLDTVLHPKL